MTRPLRVLSLGAGVQSTTLALMAAHGELEPPDCAIFADTGDEPAAIYRHLDWLETQLPFPVERVRRADKVSLSNHILHAITNQTSSSGNLPLFTKDPDGMWLRQCTKEFKVLPIQQALRRRLGLKPGERGPQTIMVQLWLGISTDEAHRMKPSERRWIAHQWPLVERG